MSKALEERLMDAQKALDKVHAALGRHPGRLPVQVETSIRALADSRADIDYWMNMIEARRIARQELDGLESRVDGDGLVPFGMSRVKYGHVRFLGVQAYVVTNWALADRITGMVGRVLCTPHSGNNKASPAQFVRNFVQKDRSKTTAGGLFESMRRAFGWPAAVSYAIRNHFVHDGAQFEGSEFFEGTSAASAFRISEDGWARVEETAQDAYGVDSSLHRAGANWPGSPREDLRVILTVCEREMDDALGVVLGSACNLLLTHVGFLFGED